MKLIIDIDKDVYDDIEHNKGEYINTLNWAVRNGTPISTEGDLISRKALKEDINSLYEYDTTYNEEFDAGVQSIINFIDNAPTIPQTIITEFKGCDNCELERPKGEWIDCKDIPYLANCSICGYQMDTHEERGYFNYCPYCGANMKGDAK